MIYNDPAIVKKVYGQSHPVLASGSSWYKGTTAKSNIKTISIMPIFQPEGDEVEVWNADDQNNGDIKCYVSRKLSSGLWLIISGNDSGKIKANADSSYAFSGSTSNTQFQNVTTIDGLEYLDTSDVTNMSYMFSGLYYLTNLNLSSFNTRNVNSIDHMFYSCSSLTSLDLSSFDTSKAINTSYMFYSCSSLTSLDLSSFDTSNVDTMHRMFSGCTKLTSLNISNFNTSKVNNMTYMFNNCFALTNLDLSSFNTSTVTNMSYMFYACRALTSLDLSVFYTNEVTNMNYMFSGCISLVTIYASNRWSTSTVTNSTGMFNNCTKLVGDIAFDSSKVDKTYATTSGGYLTYKAAS